MREESVILGIMRDVGIYDFVVDRVGDESKAIALFRDDFESLVNLCRK